MRRLRTGGPASASLRARLAYKQAIQTYIYSWKQLVAAINVRQLPLSEVAGRVDSAIPYYDFDAILAYVLRNHTDVLTARNGIEKARYNLKLAQVTPVPDVDVNVGVLKDYSLAPHQMIPTLTLGVPIPVWDRKTTLLVCPQLSAFMCPAAIALGIKTALVPMHESW